jgi:transposase
MRKDIKEAMERLKKEEIKPNYAELAKTYGCDYRTVKRYFEQEEERVEERKQRPSKLDGYREIIETKAEIPCTAAAIYQFIRKQGFTGKYTIVKQYCRSLKREKQQKATIRFETSPGLQGQIDWKESMRLTSRQGEVFEINIFLMILGYSRLKYLELTMDRGQSTLFQAIVNGFQYFGGVPHELLVDNMKTVIDQSRTAYGKAVVNARFYEFSKDLGFEVIACRAYRPETKGKVESLAKIMERLRVYNGEFETVEELDEFVREMNRELNLERSQATGSRPIDRFQKEKEYLIPLPQQDILASFNTQPLTRKVSRESMITYNKSKYSVSPKHIGRIVELTIQGKWLQIYYNKEWIKTHEISEKAVHYDATDMREILKSDVFLNRSDNEIERYIAHSLAIYDQL